MIEQSSLRRALAPAAGLRCGAAPRRPSARQMERFGGVTVGSTINRRGAAQCDRIVELVDGRIRSDRVITPA